MNLTFLVGLIARPTLEGDLPMSWGEFDRCSQEGLPRYIAAQLRRLRGLADVENLRALAQNEPLNPCGNWTAEMARSSDRSALPPFFRGVLETYSDQQLIENYPRLLVEFFERDAEQWGNGGFIGAHFHCEFAARWALAQMRSERLGREDGALADIRRSEGFAYVERALDWVAQWHPDFLLRVDQLFRLNQKEPLELQFALSEWRLTYIEELLLGECLGADRLLGSCAQLMICTEWRRMSRERGLELLNAMRQSDERRAIQAEQS